MKKLYVIGDSNIYGDEQLNDNLGSVAKAMAYDWPTFNWPSCLTYPYYIPLRKVNNVSCPGLSAGGIADFYKQLVLPILNSDDELIIHIPPVTRDVIYEPLDDYYTKVGVQSKAQHIFNEWCTNYSGLPSTAKMFKICMGLFKHNNFNPSKLEQYGDYAPGIAEFLNDTYWSSSHGLNRFMNLIHDIETTAPCKVFYVFQTFTFNSGDDRLWGRKRKLTVKEKLLKMLAPFDIDIVNRIIDDNWIHNMKTITRELDFDIYPAGHFHAKVHKEYCNRFVKKHFLA